VTDARFWPPGALTIHVFETPAFCVTPFLPQGGIALLHGPPGVGKSQLALTLGLAVATGTEFLTPEYKTLANNVLYIQLDVIAPIQQERMHVLNGKYGAAPLAFFTMTDRFNVLQPPRGPPLDSARAFNPSLVIIDALRDTHTLDEDESATVPIVFGAWRTLFPDATLVFLHHDRKVQLVPGGSERMFSESARGSGAWLAKVDCGLHMTDVKGDLTMFFSKVRTCPPQAPLAVKLNDESLLVELTKPTPRQQALTKIAEFAAHGKRWSKGAAAHYLQTECRCPKATAYRIAKELGLE